MRYKKHFTFYANAPVDRGNVDVAVSSIVLQQALNGLSVFDCGVGSGASAYAQEWANMNFSPLQKALYAPIPKDVNASKINYLRVDFYKDDDFEEDNDVSATYFYFVDDVKPDDEGESANGDLLYFFALTLDPWATNVLYEEPRFFGGEITVASDITPGRFPHASGDALRASSVVFPFNVEKWQSNANEEQHIGQRIPVFLSYEFSVIASITGKDLGRAVFAVSTFTDDGLKKAIEATNALCTAKKLYIAPPNSGTAQPDILTEGQFSIQGVWIVPREIAPEVRSPAASYWYIVGNPEDTNTQFSFADISGPLHEGPIPKKTVVNFWKAWARSLGGTEEEQNELIEREFAKGRSVRRVDIGTTKNRVDITEQVFKNYTKTNGDASIIATYGFQTFEIFMHIAGKQIDITNEFQAYTILDPENDFIKQNKTNSILSGLGSIGTIAGGVVSVASGAGAGLGIAAIASGATSLASNVGRWQEGTSAPDVVKGVGYADTTNMFGGVYMTVVQNVNAWDRAIALNGFKTQVPTGGEWFIRAYYETRAAKCFALAVDGARISGLPAGDAEEISTLFKRGVRIWYDAAAWAERTP